MPKQKPILAWHFVRANRKLGYGDNNMVAAGYVYEVEGPPFMCRWGLHASRSVWGALYWATGPHVCRARCSGEIIEHSTKLVATRREVLWMADASAAIHEFADWLAKEQLQELRKKGMGPDKRLCEAIALKRAWIKGLVADCSAEARSHRASQALANGYYDGKIPGARQRLLRMIMALKP